MRGLFSEGALSDFLEKARSVVKSEVEREEREKLLNVNETDYINYLVQKHRLEPISFDVANLTASESEQQVPAERYPGNWNVVRGKSYPRQVVTFHLPYSGFEDLLYLTPSTRILWTEDVQVLSGEIAFSIVVFDQGPEGINLNATINRA